MRAIQTMQYGFLLLICDAVHNVMTSQQCNTNSYCIVVTSRHYVLHRKLAMKVNLVAYNESRCNNEKNVVFAAYLSNICLQITLTRVGLPLLDHTSISVFNEP